MTKSMGLMVCAGMALCSVAVAHPGTPTSAPFSGQKVEPVRAAKVTRDAAGNVRMVGGWITLGGASRGTPAMMWDGFESCPREPGGAPVGFSTDASGTPVCAVDPCGGDSRRWWFGNDYFNPHIITDYQAAVGTSVTDLDMAINFSPLASTGCLIVAFSYDTVSLDGAVLGNGQAVDGFINGVILDYGNVAPSGGGGWYHFVANDLAPGLLDLAADAEGGVEWIVAETFTDTDGDGQPDTLTLHGDAVGDNGGIQMMLWGTGEDEKPTADLTRVGNGTEVQYDDDNPTDGLFDDPDGDGFINEAYSYAFGDTFPPNPLGGAWQAFGAGGPPGCPADFNDDGFLDFFDADAFVACFEGIECPPGKDCDYNGDFFCDFFDLDQFVADFEAGC